MLKAKYWENTKTILRRLLSGLLVVFGIGIVLGGFVIAFTSASSEYAATGAMIVGVVVWYVGCLMRLETPSRWSWQQIPLRQHRGTIPLTAQKLALKISKNLPKVEFWVETFTNRKRTADPFFGVKYGSKEYYFYVWDEPKFETQ